MAAPTGRLLHHVKTTKSVKIGRLVNCVMCKSQVELPNKLFSSHRGYSQWTKISGKFQQRTFLERVYLKNQPDNALRCFTTTQGPFTQDQQLTADDPFSLVKSDFTTFYSDINNALHALPSELNELATYHFDGKGKSFRPMVVMLVAKACNNHVKGSEPHDSETLKHQRQVAMISEMIHTASLIHDDVIDASTTRRGKRSVQNKWGHRKAVLCADYILSVSSIMLARIGDEEVVEVLSQVLEDLVRGEFMQLGSRENENERFAHYLKKTFKKTASLIANACKAVAILGDCSEETVNVAFQYGRNIGMAFQLVDDLLDFISSEAMMGKPTTADLKLGLATAPVLFAAQEHPELNALIMRRFAKVGDVEKARKLVEKSDGIKQTKFLAEQHSNEAVRVLQNLNPSIEREALVTLTNKLLNRLK